MPRIVGVFEDGGAVDNVVEQLQLNGVTQFTILRPDDDKHALDQQLSVLTLPDEQVTEYRERLASGRWLLHIHVGALELPTVQRALRSGQAIDIDLLPESNQG